MKEKLIFSAFILLIMGVSCTNNAATTCLMEYDGKIDYTRAPHLTIDSLLQSESGCEYLISTIIELEESFIAEALMYQQNDIIYLRGIDPVQTKDFVLFDFNLTPQQIQEVKIFHNSLQSNFSYSLEKKITISEGPEVYIFKATDLVSYGEENLDVVFFVTKEYGVIGSYATMEEKTEEGEEIMFSPGGNILKDYIDYSNFSIRKLL